MITIPTNYPSECTNEEIFRVIQELSQEMISGGGNINVILRFTPLISVGQAELQKRILEKNALTTTELHSETVQLKEIAKNNNISSENYAKASKLISIIALIISVLAILVSAYFSIKADQSSKEWQNAQIKILQDLDSNSKAK